MFHNFNKRKLLFCSACSGNNTHEDLGRYGGGFLLAIKEMSTDLDRQSVSLEKMTAVIK